MTADDVIDVVGQALSTCRSEELPDGAPDSLADIVTQLTEICGFARSLADGELDATLRWRGEMAGALKTLQASLRHLTWQAERVAAGDFEQRVDFMGDFSRAFNSMVVALKTAREDLSRRNDALMRLNGRLEEMATTDALTGVLNRRRFWELLNDELRRTARYGEHFSLIMLDIDHFKRINDTYGHAVGDAVLKELARAVQTELRANDRLCRWGGEEFVVLTPRTPQEEAFELAERLRKRVSAEAGSTAGTVTVSLGVAGHRAGESGDDILTRADEALYRAKENGRDRCEAAD